jgi:hypothetical protein
MSEGPVNFIAERVRRQTDCEQTTVADLLATISDDVARGEFNNPKRMAIIIVDQQENGNEEISTYRCGMNRAEEIGYFDRAKRDRHLDWSSE